MLPLLICTLPLVAIGITPKSYGYFHYDQLAHKGIKFLKNQEQMPTSPEARAAMLPGISYNDSSLIANDAFQNYFSAEKGMQPNYAKYRFLQIMHSFKNCYFDRTTPSSDLNPLVARMTFGEKIKYGTTFTLGFSFLRLIPAKLRSNTILWLRGLIGQHKFQEAPVVQRNFSNLIEVFELFASKDVRTEPNG